MQNIFNFYKKLNIYLLGLVIFTIRLPPIYILPVNTAFFNSHSLARYLLFALLVFTLLMIYVKRISIRLDHKLIIIILFYFFTQSISVISAGNIIQFLALYKHIIVGIILYFVTFVSLNSNFKIKIIINILIASMVVNAFYEFFIYFRSDIILSFLKNISYGQYWDVLYMNFQRQRFFVDIYDSALVPLLLFSLSKSNKVVQKILLSILIGIVSFFALVSNFRTQLFMVLISLILGSLIFYRKALIISASILLTCLFLYVGYTISISYVGYNSLDRVISPGEEEYSTIIKRVNMWSQSAEMAQRFPLTGIGLGNFYDNLPSYQKVGSSPTKWVNDLQQISETNPHNIFFAALAETGYLGLLSIVILISFFLAFDIKSMKIQNPVTISTIIAFWSLFVFALFNPPVTLPYISLFWVLRALISASNKLSYGNSKKYQLR